MLPLYVPEDRMDGIPLAHVKAQSFSSIAVNIGSSFLLEMSNVTFDALLRVASRTATTSLPYAPQLNNVIQ